MPGARAGDALDEPLRRVLGEPTAKALARHLDLRTVGDLLRHYPRRYEQRGELTPLADLQVDDDVTVLASVHDVTTRSMRHRRGSLLEVVVTDGTGRLTLTFFNQAWRAKDLRAGRLGLFAGKVTEFRRVRQLTHPDYVLLDDGIDASADPADALAGQFARALIPTYPSAAAIRSWNIAKAVATTLDSLDRFDDPLPGEVRERQGLVGLREALEGIHRPSSWDDVRAAKARLRFDEAFLLQVALARRRVEARRTPARPRPAGSGGLVGAFEARLPFELTAGQREVGEVIERDLAQSHPMHRLLQGEVGSGKTVVALRAMLTVVDAGGQAALLAPTEVLAMQHHRSIRELLGPLAMAGELGGDEGATGVALLTGSSGARARRAALADAASGAAGIVVGTHALLEEAVEFADLGLVVVDEQHRFGVRQRDALRSRGAEPPHVLVMTATPIPRTVAMTVFGDLETSALTELPRGRSPIRTFVVPDGNESWLTRMWGRVRDEVAAGHQAYVVCPRIGEGTGPEDSPDADPDAGAGTGVRVGVEGADGADGADGEPAARRPAAAVAEVLPLLAGGELAGLRLAALHGRLPPDEKDAVMRRFAVGEIDVLVATTVIEVGVDVPNATVMVVLDADRFGVSQLHQLRGRVGRGSAPGWCLLHTAAPADGPARGRIDAVASTLDGFELARVDLEQRREGDVLGAAQSGARTSLRLLRLTRDGDVILAAREEATALVEADPDLSGRPALAHALAQALDPERAEYLAKA
ncbi:MAG: ATP-dependent DNA helicase RecG [Frankiaceae bacterium]